MKRASLAYRWNPVWWPSIPAVGFDMKLNKESLLGGLLFGKAFLKPQERSSS